MAKKLLFFFFLIIFLGTIIFLLLNWVIPFLQPNTGQLAVNTQFQSSTVFLDNKKLGATPFYSKELKTGDHTVVVESEGTKWETKTTLSSGTFNTLDINITTSTAFISGENLFFRKGQKSLVVLSKPAGAKVFLDNKEKGSTPIKLEPPEGVTTLTLKKDGYLSRELNPNVVNGYRLTANVFLSVDPFGTTKKLDANSKITLFSLHNSFVNLSKSYADWVEGVQFTQRQLGSTNTRFDILLDPNGKTYILDQTQWKNKLSTKAVANVGYLATKPNDTLSEKANEPWQKLKIQFN